MKFGVQLVLVGLAAAALGGLGSHGFGSRPAAGLPAPAPAEAWHDGWQGGEAKALTEAARTWADTPPWGAPPAAAASAEPPPPPPPMPVGVAKEGRNYVAIFQVNGSGVMRLRANGQLPDGGRVLQVSGRKIVWRDGKGERQQHEIFNHFLGGQ